MKRNTFNNLIIFGLIVIFLGGLITLILFGKCLLNCDSENYVSDTITFLVGLATYCGTMILGIIAFWQTKNANEISKIIAIKEMASVVEYTGKVKIARIRFDTELVLKRENAIGGFECVICSTEGREKLIKHSEKDEYLELCLRFRSKGAPIRAFKINRVGFNNAFKNEIDLIKYYLSFNVLNKMPVICSDIVSEEEREICFDLNFDFDILTVLNEKGFLVFDFESVITSVYGIKQEQIVSCYIEKIDDLENNIKNPDYKELLKINNINVILKELRNE